MTDRRRWLGLPFIALGVALIIVDSTIVNVAIPSIIDDLAVTSTQAQWVQETYTLVFASLLLVFGRIADRTGRRAMFALGVLIFVVSSVLAATVDSGNALIAARLIQGIGGAMMLPTSLSILNSTFFGKDRGIAFAVWGSTIGAAAAFGPLLGGWLTTSFSWRWAFGINVPLGVIILVGLFAFVNESRSTEEARGADFFGAFLSVIGIGSIVFGLIEGRNYGWFTALQPVDLLGFTWNFSLSIVPVAFLLGASTLLLFIKVEVDRNRSGKAVLLDLRLLAIPSFRNANIAAAIVSLGEFGLLFALPLWLQNVLGYSAFETGLILLALAVGSFTASGAGAALGNSKGAVFVVRTGIVLEILGIGISGLVIAIDTPWWMICLPLFIYGAGVGLATAQLTGVALADVPIENSGQGSGITSTTRQLGSALGIAILGTVLFSSLGNDFSQRLEAFPQITTETRNELTTTVVQSAGAVIPGFMADPQNQAIGVAAGEALTYGTKLAAFVGAAFLVLGWLATLRLKGKAPNGIGQTSESLPNRE